jgi:hypothetical protein
MPRILPVSHQPEAEDKEATTFVALAGRRIDAVGADIARFPLARVPLVRERLREELRQIQPRALICSAACGADLLASRVAIDLDIQVRLILPFAAERFRETSVADRPGDWGPAFDQMVEHVRAHGDLQIVETGGDESEAYAAVNRSILDQAQQLAAHAGVEAIALIVWEGRSRGKGDLTEAFRDDARKRRMRVLEVLTLE